MEKTKLTIIITVFIDVLGMGIVMPILPFFVEHVGGGPEWVTRLFMIFAVCSFFSMPFLGRLSDIIGRRPVLLASIFSTALGWIIFATAHNIWFLLIGRVVDGIAAGNFSTAQSYLSDISANKEERAKNMGVIGAIFGIAFLIGPAIGGLLGNISPTLPFWVVGIMATINFILGYFYLPETNHNRQDGDISFNPFTPIKKAISDKKLLPFHLVWLVFSVGISIQMAIGALYMSTLFGFTASTIGILMAVQGLIIIFNQAWALKKFWLSRFNEITLILISAFFLGAGSLISTVPNIFIFIIGTLTATFMHPIFRTVMTSEMVGLAPVTEKGEVLGIMASVMSLGMIIGPAIAEPLYAKTIYGPYFAAGIIFLLAFVILYYKKNTLLAHAEPVREDVEVI